MENSISHIFDKDPECGWGGHGDILFWNLLRARFWYADGLDVDQFDEIVRDVHRQATGKEMKPGTETGLKKGLGAIVGSNVTPDWWFKEALPLLHERLEFHVGGCTGGKYRVAVLVQDITKRAEEVMVCPTNSMLASGGGVCGAIHKAAGPDLAAECANIKLDENGERCPVGEIRATRGYGLKAAKVYHVVPPNCQRGLTAEKRGQLRWCYVSIFNQVAADGVKSIALPSIGTGKLAFPVAEAAEVASELIVRSCKVDPELKVVVCCASEKDARAYRAAIRKIAEEWL